MDLQRINESGGSTRGDVDDIIVLQPAGPTVEYLDEGKWCEEELQDDDYRNSFGLALEGACNRFYLLTPIPNMLYELTRRYARAANKSDRLDLETDMLRILRREIKIKRDTLRNEQKETLM